MRNLSKNVGKWPSFQWDMLFGQVCWMIWINPNKLVFEGKTKPLHAISFKVNATMKEVLHAH